MRKMIPREGRHWPGYILGGRLRTSTAALLIAFCAILWLYETYEAPRMPTLTQVPASEVVPPGFVPDPNYTWAPRTDVQSHNTETSTTTSATPEPSASPTSAAPSSSPVPSTTSARPTASPVAPEPSASTPPPAGGGADAPVPPTQ